MSFTVVFEPAEKGGYVVTCPALPGVVTQGETLEDARAMATDAIRGSVESLITPAPAADRPVAWERRGARVALLTTAGFQSLVPSAVMPTCRMMEARAPRFRSPG